MAYYNSPYNLFPVSYANQMGYSANVQPVPMVQQPMPMSMQMSAAPQQNMMSAEPRCAMTWVGDEAEARGRQIPQGVNMYFMWDSTQNKIYLKTLNQMGLPNPMQIIYYNFGNEQGILPAGTSGTADPHQAQQEQNAQSVQQVDMSQYVTKDELNQMRNELRSVMNRGNSSQQGQSYAGNSYPRNNNSASANQNGSNNGSVTNASGGNTARGGNT